MAFLRRVVVLAATVFAALVAQTNGTRGARPYTTWTAYGGSADSSQYSALDQINRSNVSQLQVAWTFRGVGRDAGDLCDWRPAVHRRAGCGRKRNVLRALQQPGSI